jgi:hypothetical protein
MSTGHGIVFVECEGMRRGILRLNPAISHKKRISDRDDRKRERRRLKRSSGSD